MRPDISLDPAYFENMFAETPDPWRFETSPYEAAKYDHTIEALADGHYAEAFEVGCANGVLSARLAPLCDRLLAIDVSRTALTLAQKRCVEEPKIRFEQMVFPKERPDLLCDLVILSEVAYYWNALDLERAGDWLAASLKPGGRLILVHWTGETDYPQTGDGAVEVLYHRLRDSIDIERGDRCEKYRLDLWRRR